VPFAPITVAKIANAAVIVNARETLVNMGFLLPLGCSWVIALPSGGNQFEETLAMGRGVGKGH
jgi:hypothetical protein